MCINLTVLGPTNSRFLFTFCCCVVEFLIFCIESIQNLVFYSVIFIHKLDIIKNVCHLVANFLSNHIAKYYIIQSTFDWLITKIKKWFFWDTVYYKMLPFWSLWHYVTNYMFIDVFIYSSHFIFMILHFLRVKNTKVFRKFSLRAFYFDAMLTEEDKAWIVKVLLFSKFNVGVSGKDLVHVVLEVLTKSRMRTCATNQVSCASAHARLSQHLLKPRVPGQKVF